MAAGVEDARAGLADELERWLDRDAPPTLQDLVATFGPRSFAVAFVVLLAFPALPLPTGGLSHVLEALAMLLALELVAGRREPWVPRRLAARPLTGLSSGAGRALVGRVRRLERRARPRLPGLLARPLARRGYGAAVFGLSLTAFAAPPFSGLDTLPALGVVVMSVGVLAGDALLCAAGTLLGATGVAVVVGLGEVVRRALW